MKKTILTLALFASLIAFAQTPAPNETAATPAKASAAAPVPDDYYDGEYNLPGGPNWSFTGIRFIFKGKSGTYTQYAGPHVSSPCARGESPFEVLESSVDEVVILTRPYDANSFCEKRKFSFKRVVEGNVIYLIRQAPNTGKFVKR